MLLLKHHPWKLLQSVVVARPGQSDAVEMLLIEQQLPLLLLPARL
jgi:hypothetical protein